MIPTDIGMMGDLKDLQIYNNMFVGPLPSEIGNCYQLEKLEIQDNQFTGTFPVSLGTMEKLEVMKVYRNLSTGTMPKEVCELKETFALGFIGADCNKEAGGPVVCDCCATCYP